MYLQQQLIPQTTSTIHGHEPQRGQQFLMNKVINYDTDDNDCTIPTFFSPMFAQVSTIIDPGDDSKKETEWARQDPATIKITGVNYTQEPGEKTGLGKPISKQEIEAYSLNTRYQGSYSHPHQKHSFGGTTGTNPTYLPWTRLTYNYTTIWNHLTIIFFIYFILHLLKLQVHVQHRWKHLHCNRFHFSLLFLIFYFYQLFTYRRSPYHHWHRR